MAREEQPGPEERTPPPPVSPWRVPPFGSAGDAWDEVIRLPAPPRPAEPPRKRTRPKKRTGPRRPDEVIFRPYSPRLHPAVIVAWMLVASGFLSTGPVFPAMAFMGMLGAMVGGLALWLLKTKHLAWTGEKLAIAAIVTGSLLIVPEALPRRPAWFEDVWVRARSSRVSALSFDAKMRWTRETMGVTAQAAVCAWRWGGTAVTGVGRDSVNRDVFRGSDYFSISSVAHLDRDPLPGGLNRDSFPWADAELPADPFADDPRATYGVYFTERFILVYSAGPDGEWQINPRRPVEEDTRNPFVELEGAMFDPLDGERGMGDIILIERIDDVELGLFCDEVREKLEVQGWMERQ